MSWEGKKWYFEKNIDMAQNSTHITRIAFSELKAEKNQLVTKN